MARPTIVQLEVAKWLTLEAGEDKADEVIAFTEKRVVVALDTRLALAAAEVSTHHKLATADAIVYATAEAYGADILTCDAHFKDLPGMTLIAKNQTPGSRTTIAEGAREPISACCTRQGAAP